jgi:hypothetical protein
MVPLPFWLHELRMYLKMYSFNHTNIMEKCLEDQILYISRQNEVGVTLESFSNLAQTHNLF